MLYREDPAFIAFGVVAPHHNEGSPVNTIGVVEELWNRRYGDENFEDEAIRKESLIGLPLRYRIALARRCPLITKPDSTVVQAGSQRIRRFQSHVPTGYPNRQTGPDMNLAKSNGKVRILLGRFNPSLAL
jgi:hypothetical protein